MNNSSGHTVAIRKVFYSKTDKISEVSANVAGMKVWFRSADIILRTDALAFLIAYYFAINKTGYTLFCEQQIKESRRKNLKKIDTLTSEWWGSEPRPFLEFGKNPDIEDGIGKRIGAFFSCDVDSFDALLEREKEIDDLILVHGLNIPLPDTEHFRAIRSHSEAIASQMGKRLIVVETNLREHPILQTTHWTQCFGAALAAIGHLLADELGTLLIPARHPSDALQPSGSHLLLEHLWSSGHLKIEHTGDDASRHLKIKRHGNNSLIQSHLIVCRQNKGLSLNCGICEKCLRTQIEFLCFNYHIPNTFPEDVNLATALRSITRIKSFSNIYESALISPHISDEIKQEIRALLFRSQLESANPDATNTPHWNKSVVTSRIQDTRQRVRHQAGSPNQEEITAYANYLPSEEICAEGTVIVLGMTPELRQMAVQRFNKVITFDTGEAAINTYRNWVPDELKNKEKIYSIDWRHLCYFDWSLYPPVCAVIGDGIFGNMPDVAAQGSLLQSLSGLFPNSVFIFRKALAEFAYKSDQETLQSLKDAYRSQLIGDDAFGFSVRLQGFLHTHFDEDTFMLDNASLFHDCMHLHNQGFFKTQEWEAIQRFRFDGFNCLLTKTRWESLLEELGFSYQYTVLSSLYWSSFYPVYCLKTSS